MATAAEQAEIDKLWNRVVATADTEFLAGLSAQDRMRMARRRVQRWRPIGRALTAREGAGHFPSGDWYAVFVKPSCEKAAADGFRGKKVQAYWPSYRKQILVSKGRLGHRRRRAVLSPIMPGMIFCPTADADLFWTVIKRVPYVRSLMRNFSSELMTLTCEDVAIILQIEADQNAPSPPTTTAHRFEVGDDVRFVGDINGRWPPGRIIGLSRDGRLSIEVAGVMGCALPFLACSHQIERIS
jgi:transcription antitermination factor NusG